MEDGASLGRVVSKGDSKVTFLLQEMMREKQPSATWELRHEGLNPAPMEAGASSNGQGWMGCVLEYGVTRSEGPASDLALGMTRPWGVSRRG